MKAWDLYRNDKKIIDDNTIVMTNSSTFLPSTFKEDISKPERYLTSFANGEATSVRLWDTVIPGAYDEVVELKPSTWSYQGTEGTDLVVSANSVLVPFLNSATVPTR